MAREKASINVDIWGDADFRNLTPQAQALYFKLSSHPKLDYCGVVEFHPGRLAAMSRGQAVDDVMVAAQELSDTYYCVFDQNTDEVMVRGFLRHDGLLLQPRLVVSAAKAYAAIGSNKIRAVVVDEVQRFQRENADLAAWKKPQMVTLLKQQALPVRETVTGLVWEGDQRYGQGYDHLTENDDHPDDQDYDQSSGKDYGQRLGETLINTTTGPTTATATTTSTETPTGVSCLPASRRKPKKPLPDDWVPNESCIEYACEQEIDVRHEAQQFRAHAGANDRRQQDWNLAFRTWLGNAQKWRPQSKKSKTEQIVDVLDLGRRLHEHENRKEIGA